MKISNAGRTSGVSSSRRSGKAPASGGAKFAEHLPLSHGADDEGCVVDGPPALTGVESLLAIQAVDEDGGRDRRDRNRFIQRGEDLLACLEDIRCGVLLGRIPMDHLTRLAQTVRSQRAVAADPSLAALLDEIELRAAVELAKLERP